MDINQCIAALIDNCVKQKLITDEDRIYCANRLAAILKLDNPNICEYNENFSIPQILDLMIEYAVKNEIIEDLFDEKEILSANIMNIFVSKPSEINDKFYMLYKTGSKNATNYFYNLSRDSNYIQTQRIAKNISYKVNTDYGELDITINLSKPEKNPKDIAAAKNISQVNYPKCLLCIENEGYEGRINHPARANLRTIRLSLGGERWHFQYSPYAYYNEHCIILSGQHRDMKIDRAAFCRLIEFVYAFPHYFLGSNADLPIVGGSILTHDHYQGGHYEFAMAKAENEYYFNIPNFENIKCSVIKWPMSVIRLCATDKEKIIDTAEHILNKWRMYSDESVEIKAFSGNTPHNTITPIARIRDEKYELDLILRNNRQTKEHPLGIFHPHEDVQHIKKENIGLIEAMGLAVLPGRLVNELHEVEKYIAGIDADVAQYHKKWADQLKDNFSGNENEIEQYVRNAVGNKFLRVLEDAGVFKRNEEGQLAFKRFINSL